MDEVSEHQEPCCDQPSETDLAPRVPTDQLRASDHDRALVTDVLSAAYADGRLTRDELDQRLATAQQARTFGELTPLTADLVATGVPDGHGGVARRNGLRVGTATHTRQVHLTVMGSRRPPAGAPVAASNHVASMMGEVVLDLRGSSFAAPVCTITVQCVMGSVAIIVPDGVTVRDETLAVMGESRVRGTRPRPGAPVLVLRGVVLMGSLVVRGPAS